MALMMMVNGDGSALHDDLYSKKIFGLIEFIHE